MLRLKTSSRLISFGGEISFVHLLNILCSIPPMDLPCVKTQSGAPDFAKLTYSLVNYRLCSTCAKNRASMGCFPKKSPKNLLPVPVPVWGCRDHGSDACCFQLVPVELHPFRRRGASGSSFSVTFGGASHTAPWRHVEG